MNFIKQYKMTLAAILVFIILVVAGHFAYSLLVTNNESDICYGRDEGKDLHPIASETYQKVKESLESQKFVSNVSTDEKCLLVKVSVTVSNDATTDQAKSLGKLVLDEFSDDQKSFYDFQLIVSKEDKEKTDFPMIASKHKTSSEFVWTKDRVTE